MAKRIDPHKQPPSTFCWVMTIPLTDERILKRSGRVVTLALTGPLSSNAKIKNFAANNLSLPLCSNYPFFKSSTISEIVGRVSVSTGS